MRLLHKACGQILLQIHQDATEKNVYVEKVSEMFEKIQNEYEQPEVIRFGGEQEEEGL